MRRWLRRLAWPLARLYDLATGPLLAVALRPAVLFRRAGRDLPLAEARAILVVRLDEIGDAVLLVPFLRALRASAPRARIALVVKPKIVALLEHCPYVDQIAAFDGKIDSRLHRLGRLRRIQRLLRETFAGWRFDAALAPRWDVDFDGVGALLYLSGAGRRVAYSEQTTPDKQIVNRGADRLLTQPVTDSRRNLHDLDRSLALLRAAGGEVAGGGEGERLELWWTADDERAAAALLAEAGAPMPARWIALGPAGGGNPLKAWPEERFPELMRRYAGDAAGGAEGSAGCVVIGGPGDRALCERVADAARREGLRAVSAAGALTLRETAALLSRCEVYVGADSGPMHIAAATGIRTVALFGASCPHRFRPRGPRAVLIHAALPCGPCAGNAESSGEHRDRCFTCVFPSARCMESITVGEVARAAAAPSEAEPAQSAP